ncbi:hypothetical protein BASA81_007525 [Batrachochytrium salamandrivorans]|nr:hypothetical protein BASA81_007525 [Batrachochytrium salamandrivorans]
MSLLSRQLESHRTANPLPPPADGKKSRPTVLFSSAHAGNLDAKQVLDLGRNGFQKLCQTQPSLQDYQALFGTALGSDPKSEHHLLPRSEKVKVDAMCQALLHALSPLYSLEAGMHVLEFLIQRYQVHIVSPDALLGSLLPHHDTKLFSTVVRLTMAQPTADTTKWTFLKRFQDAPNGVPRSALVAAAVKDVNLLDNISTVSVKSSPKFFAAFALECLALNLHMDTTVLVVCRNVVDLLKSHEAVDRNLAALVISGLARTVTLSSDASEALLMLLAKRAGKVDDGTDLVKALIMLYEWQSIQRGVSLFTDPNKWEKFSLVLERIFPQVIKLESQQQMLFSLVDRSLQVGTKPVELFAMAQWNEPVYASRATRIVREIVQLADQSEWSAVMQQISLEQPSAFQSASGKEEEGEIQMQFEDANTVFLALRNPNRMIRLAALKHLETSTEHQTELTASVVSHWAELFLDTNQDAHALGRMVALFGAAASPMDAELIKLLKQVVLATLGKTMDGGDELAINAMQVIKSDIVFVASVQFTAQSTPVKQACDSILKKTWMHGVCNKGEYVGLAKHVRSLPSAEEKRAVVDALYAISPAIAVKAVEEMGDTSSPLLLELLERGDVPSTNPGFASKLLPFPQLALRLLQLSDQAWSNAYPVLIEAMRAAGVKQVDSVLWGPALSTVETNAVAERRLVRTLRLLACQQSSPSRWIELVGPLRYQRSSLVRTLAAKLLLATTGKSNPLSQVLLSAGDREEELRRDHHTLDRIVANDPAVRLALAEAAKSAISPESVACLVELLQDRDLARQVLLTWLSQSNTITASKSTVLTACFATYGKEPAEEVDLKVLELGLEHAPQLTLNWAVKQVVGGWPVKAKFAVFERLLQLAQDQDNAVVVDLSVKLLGLGKFADNRLAFNQQDFAKRLRAIQRISSENAKEVQVLVELISTSSFTLKSVLQELFRLIPLCREFGVLEQSLLVAVERNIAQVDGVDSTTWSRLVEEMCVATTLPGRVVARRAFIKSGANSEAFALAFTKVHEFALFADLEQALVGSMDPNTHATNQVVDALALQCFRSLPFADHHIMLARVAKWMGSPTRLISQWLSFPHASHNAGMADCVYISSQFDSSKQTDALLQLMTINTSNKYEFIAHHLGSKAYMKALVVSMDETKSVQFIQLFELLLERLVEEDEKDTQFLESALDRLSVLLSIHVFVPVMAETLAERQSVKVRNLALRVLKFKIMDEHRDWNKEETKYVMEFVYTLISWLSIKPHSSNQHATTVLALNAFALVMAPSHAHGFAKALPVLSGLLEEEGDELQRSAVLVCLGTICKSVGIHAIGFINELVPKMIACSVKGANPVLRQAALHALRDIVEAKLAVNLADLVQLVMLESGGEEMQALIESLGKAMDPRVGLSVCLGVLRKRDHAPAAAGLVLLLDQMVTRINPTEMPALQELNDLCIECCLCREAGEQIVSVVVKVALLLSEKKLKTVLDSLVVLAREKGGDTVDVVLDVLRGLVNKCGSLVLSIMPIQFMIDMLQQSLEFVAVKSNHKKTKVVVVGSTETALGAVGECLVHAIGTRFVDIQLFDPLLAVLATALEGSESEISQNFVEPAMASLALCALAQPTVNAMLQTLHHSMTRLVRSPIARVRFNALSCIKQLFERVGDDYLALMPDTLPFLAELLEDKDDSVQVLAQKLALVLKDLSGEDIAEFLK